MTHQLKQIFVCQSCGSQHPKWLGKCTDCNSWNTIVEETISKQSIKTSKTPAIPLTQVLFKEEKRIFTGIVELDRVLGGGLVHGSLTLLSGDPGIGKSTLLLQTLSCLAQRGFKVLYASGEESPSQIKLRAERLQAVSQNIYITNETNILSILDTVRSLKPQVFVMDSIQTIHNPQVPGSPGNVSQIRECTQLFMQMAKTENIATFIVGHVTKEGMVAGPKLLEHLVDTVLYLEGDSSHGHRILRSHKNRFGSTGEIGVFIMQGHGLTDVPNPSALFLDGYQHHGEGSAVAVSIEGTRPLLVEIQTLVGKTSFSTPRRLATGFDSNRFTILLAVLEKRAGLYLSGVDVYANIAGGLKLMEPAIDLATALSVASSFLSKPVPAKCAFFGEVGLSGEIRSTNHPLLRIQEAQKLGFEKIYIPARNYHLEKENIQKIIDKEEQPLFIVPVESIYEAISILK